MKISTIVFIFVFWGLSVLAQDISMTVTQDNLALVKETRSLSLQKGINSILIKDLPSQLEPTSVYFSFKDQSIKLNEYYFAYDLESTQLMLEKSIGKSIRVLHPDLGTVQGKLVSVQSGMLVIEDVDGELRVMTNYSGAQFIFEKSEWKESLVMEPTLFCSLQSGTDLKTKTEISYSTSGINWNTEYTAIINETEDQLSLSTRAVISNYSGKIFQNVKLLLLAGEINRRPTLRRSVAGAGYQEMGDMVTMASEPDFQEISSFEYHSYRLGRNITLENQQQKMLPLYPIQETEISKIYTYHYQKDPTGISVVISALNSKDSGLGHPLPAGTVRILKKEDDRLIILGEDRISHTPVEEEIKLKIGQAFDIIAERKVLDRKREGKNNEKMKISIEFRNRKNEDIEILVTEPITRRYDYRILSGNIEVYKKEAKQVEFIVPVKANQTNTLEYEILYTW
jgi:hypothetical protein